jgi:hypothetical protein
LILVLSSMAITRKPAEKLVRSSHSLLCNTMVGVHVTFLMVILKTGIHRLMTKSATMVIL